MCRCMIEALSDLPQQSLEIDRYLRKSQVILGNFWKMFGNVCLAFGKYSQIFGKSSSMLI